MARRWKVSKIRILAPLAGLLTVAIFSTIYLFKQSRCRIVYELGSSMLDMNKQNDSVAIENLSNNSVQLLTVPEDIATAVGPSEWISRTIRDSKRECPPSLDSKENKINSALACQIPNINPFHQSIMKLLRDVPMPKCPRNAYGKLVDGKIELLDPTVVSANYRAILRVGDFRYVLGKSVPIPANDSAEKIKDEFIEVEYLLESKKSVKELFLQPVPHEKLLKRTAQKKPGIPLNILIVGVDSLSHANARRKLPKVYKFLKEDLGSVIFNGHSIVGDGTTEQLAAMLTGLGELEQYESRRHHKNPRPVDGWSWIYKQLKESGYLTGYSGDGAHIGPFQYRLMGFKDPPTDFYTRPFYLYAEKRMKGKDMCLASRTVSKVQFDYIQDVFNMFKDKLKFFFSFNALYSHSSNDETAMIQPDLLSLLHDLKEKDHLNNTLLIVMGDHGVRYGVVRTVLQGKLEERLPLLSMTFPPWFKERYPEIMKTLKINTNRLTSWYDVYATFRHIISYPDLPANLKHGQSLLTEVPTSRTCAQANVEQHWCPCLEWTRISPKYSHVEKSAQAAVDYMNNANREHKESAQNCLNLTLKDINYALLERPNEKVLSFQQTNDLIPAFNDKSRPANRDFCHYQVQFTTSPNNGTYEATVRYYKEWFFVSKDISRVNKYGSQSECIARYLPHLRKFCMCRNNGDNVVHALQQTIFGYLKCD